MIGLFSKGKKFFFVLIMWIVISVLSAPVLASTTELHIVKYANDGTTILSEKTLTYHEMEDSLPVQGDGSTHYFLQGPVFVDNEDLRWNPAEDTNVQEKDMGAVKGTAVKDLCNLVGGMSSGDILKVKSSDGLTKDFAFKNVYSPTSRQGPMVISWFKDGQYPDSGYDDGMRLLFFADTSVNPWGIHAMGNFDWHESADPQYWYYYYQNADEKYPTTTGLSVKYVSDILIYSSQSTGSGSGGSGGGVGINRPAAGAAPIDDTSLYGYRGSKLTTYASGTLNGTIRLFYDPNSTPVVMKNRIHDYSISLDLPPGGNLTLARLYVYVSGSHGIQTAKGVIPSLATWFSYLQLDPEKVYMDTNGDDYRNVSATYAYDVLPNLHENSTYKITLKNQDFEENVFTADGVVLIVGYEQAQEPASKFWIAEGCDVILSDPKRGIFPRDASSSVAFAGIVNDTRNVTADLSVISTGLDALNTTEHAVRFNKGTWYNALDTPSGTKIVRIPVNSYLTESGNSASIESTIRKMDADYLVNRNAILVIGQNQSAKTDDELNQLPLIPNQSVFNSSFILNTTMRTNTLPTCNLTLHSDPEGALIFINGSYLGKTTPYTCAINPGDEYRIRLELDGFLPAERNLTVYNDTTVCDRLYSDAYSTKGRSDTLVQERVMTHNGGLYINSRPGSATISLNGIELPQRTPAVIYGLKEGTYTVQLSLEQVNPWLKEKGDILFEDRDVYVYPYSIVNVDVTSNSSPLREVIIDSSNIRGESFTVNGQVIQKTIPDKISTPVFDSFITIFHNHSYVSYVLPIILNEDHYLVVQPRQHYNLNVFVDSKPRGAEVFIDGFRTGISTPWSFANISDGPHRIMVSKTGYIPQERSINLLYTSVPISTTNVSFALYEYPNGFLKVASDPSGAEIGLDGIDTGEITPFMFFALPTGLHSITVSNKTVTKKYPDITVNALAPVTISADFQEIQD